VVAGVDTEVEHVRTDVAVTTMAETVTTAGFGLHVGPVGETTAARLTEPENPFTLVTVIVVEESDDPAGIVKDA